MASKFQNRLVGTIVIVAVSVIVLPILLDGNKKYNEIEFTTIPLVYKASDECKIELIEPIKLKPLATSSVNAVEAIISKATSDSKAKSADSLPVQQQAKSKPTVKVEKTTLIAERISKLNKKTQALQAQAYVIQLAVLKNVAKVEEIITKLRLSGYQVYTEPSLPINGQLTRIFVSPNASRDKLQSNLSELKDLTGLQGQIRGYKP